MTELPEECLVKILSYLGPKRSCRLAAVSRSFYSASQSDVLWESFLPANYRSVISQSSDQSLLTGGDTLPKKQIFRRLCERPILIDQGKKSWMLEKQGGKVTMMLGARDLSIAWGDHPVYWGWRKLCNCEFEVREVAVLLGYVWWLEIRGRIKTRTLSPDTTYVAYLVFKFEENYKFFDHHPVKIGVGPVGGGGGEAEEVKLAPCEVLRSGRRGFNHAVRAQRVHEWKDSFQRHATKPWCGERRKKWYRVRLGAFESGGEDDEVEVFVMEVETGFAKRGLVVHGVEIVPLSNA
ncbi:F-box protein PP2-B10 [Linum perenne]